MHQPTRRAVRRREFLKILGVTGAAGCRCGVRSERGGKLIPYLVSPDQTVPGVSTYFATTCRECAAACGVIAETRDGRAIKLEGNPEHPLNRGALCARGQAALQGLYNPDRYRGPWFAAKAASSRPPGTRRSQLFRQRLDEVRSGGRGGRRRVSSTDTRAAAFRSSSTSGSRAIGMAPHLGVDSDDGSRRRSPPTAQAYGVAWPRCRSPMRASSCRSAPISSTDGARASRSSSTSPRLARRWRTRRASCTSARGVRSPA